MAEDFTEITVERIRLALGSARIQDALAILNDLHPVDRAEVFNQLESDEQVQLLGLLDVPVAADLLEEMEDEDVLDAVEGLHPDRLADVLDEMEPDEAADLLGDLPPQAASEALARMEDADEVIPLLGYPDETAGGLMTTSYIGLRRQTTVRQAIEFMREISPETEVPFYLYVVDREKRLMGVVGFRELVISSPSVTMENIMDRELISVQVGVDQEEVARVMSRYDLNAVPVVDEQGRLLGVITHDDIVEVLEDEATEDIYRLANMTDTDLDPQSKIGAQIRGRLPWVFLNALTALFASWVITNFEGIIAKVAILAAFQSMVAGLGGNSASQNMAMIVRALALGNLDSRRTGRILSKQIILGILQGVVVGTIIGIGVGLWQQNAYLGLILGLAMLGNMIVAAVIGTVVPLGLRAMGIDPALGSSVLVTAATDSAGFFIFLTLATWFIHRLS